MRCGNCGNSVGYTRCNFGSGIVVIVVVVIVMVAIWGR